jgi:hypothetical protein
MTEPISIRVLRENAGILGVAINTPIEEIEVTHERFKERFSSFPEYVRTTERI